MDRKDQDTISRSSPELKKALDLSPKFLHLLQNECRVFSQQMVADILRDVDPPFKMCVMLLKRGPNAYNNFIKSLALTNQFKAIEILEATRSKLGFPAHEVLLPKSGIHAVNLALNGSKECKSNDSSIPHTLFSSEYNKKVLEPPNYFDHQGPPSPIHRSHSVTDAVSPPEYKTLDIQVVIGDEIRGLGQDVYTNRNIYPRGLALILNYEKFDNEEKRTRRIGSEKDVIHLDQLLQQIGYDVTLKSDLTLKATNDELDDFAQRHEHLDADSTIIAIMSHGEGGTHEEGTRICTRDMKYIGSEDILRRFNNVGCPLLKNKPKMFFFQFCRGENIDFGQRNFAPLLQSTGRTVTDGNAVLPTPADYDRSYDDMLIAYSTLPGYVSYREEREGTWFVKALCLIFMKHAHECHVERLLQFVDEQIKYWTASNKNGKQTLEIVKRGFNRKFYFNPGLWKMP